MMGDDGAKGTMEDDGAKGMMVIHITSPITSSPSPGGRS